MDSVIPFHKTLTSELDGSHSKIDNSNEKQKWGLISICDIQVKQLNNI